MRSRCLRSVMNRSRRKAPPRGPRKRKPRRCPRHPSRRRRRRRAGGDTRRGPRGRRVASLTASDGSRRRRRERGPQARGAGRRRGGDRGIAPPAPGNRPRARIGDGGRAVAAAGRAIAGAQGRDRDSPGSPRVRLGSVPPGRLPPSRRAEPVPCASTGRAPASNAGTSPAAEPAARTPGPEAPAQAPAPELPAPAAEPVPATAEAAAAAAADATPPPAQDGPKPEAMPSGTLIGPPAAARSIDVIDGSAPPARKPSARQSFLTDTFTLPRRDPAPRRSGPSCSGRSRRSPGGRKKSCAAARLHSRRPSRPVPATRRPTCGIRPR